MRAAIYARMSPDKQSADWPWDEQLSAREVIRCLGKSGRPSTRP